MILSSDGSGMCCSVVDPYTPLAVTMSPAPGVVRAAAYEMTDAGLPSQVTEACEVVAACSGAV
jgi:hypothetical protein